MAATPAGDGIASSLVAVALGGASGTALAADDADAELAADASAPAPGFLLEIAQTMPTAVSTPAATAAIQSPRDDARAGVAADPLDTCTPLRSVPEAGVVVLTPAWSRSGTTPSNAARTAAI